MWRLSHTTRPWSHENGHDIIALTQCRANNSAAETAHPTRSKVPSFRGAADAPVKAAIRGLLEDDAAAEARRLGLALRLAYTLCGGALELLEQVRLGRDDNGVVLELPATGSLFVGEAVQRRLDALGRSLGVESRTVRRRSPSRVLA